MKPILVTGAAGFIGSHVIRELVARGHRVRGLVLPGENLQNIDPTDGIEIVEGDVRDGDAVRRAVSGCGSVFHLASIYAVWTRKPGTIHTVNVEGTRCVLAAAERSGVERVVVTTSQGVWAGTPAGTVITEDSPPNPAGALDRIGDAYCSSKVRKHELVAEYAGRGLDVVEVAPAVPFGPGDIRPTPTGQILTSIVNLPMLTYVGTVMNPIDVRDVALGHVLAWERGRTGRAYLLGGPDNIDMPQLVQAVREITGARHIALRVPTFLAMAAAYAMKWWSDHASRRSPLIAPGALRVAKIGFRLDCTRARTELGLVPRPWRESVRDALLWFAKNGYLRRPRRLTGLGSRGAASLSEGEG